MTAQDNDAGASTGERPGELAELLRQFSGFLLALWRSSGRGTFVLLTVGIVTIILATSAMQVVLNYWNKPFYDAIERRNVGQFLYYLMVFAGIAGILLALNVAQTWLGEMIKLQTRKWLTRDLIALWLSPRRLVMIRNAGDIGVNPDQRVHEDARHLAELSAGLGIGLFQSSLLLLSFIGVLWVLSSGVTLSIHGRVIAVPGYMVWCALLYAATGSWLSWQVGRPLISIGIERYAREADLRFAMVQVSENANGITLNAGEADETLRLNDELDRVVAIMRQMVGTIARLTWVTAGYGWVGIVAPIIIAAPGYFGGQLTFGQLMMVVGAFNQVQGALRWFVDNFSTIADWRATLARVMAFREALVDLETQDHSGDHIAYETGGDRLRLDHVHIAWPDSSAAIEPAVVEIGRGERVQIVDGPGGGRVALFSALAGLWPFGAGAISMPPGARTMFLPERPYIPDGTLRLAITYPSAGADFTDEQLASALGRVELARLVPALERRARWSHELSYSEEALLTFARMLLLKPDWIFTEQPIDALDERQRRIFRSILEAELKAATVVAVTSGPSTSGFYPRMVKLVDAPGTLNAQDNKDQGGGI